MTRIRLDKQINVAPAANYVPVTDANGEMQYQTLASIFSANGNSVKTVDSMQVVGNNLILKYTDQASVQQTITQSLAAFAADVKLQGAILDHPSANVYNLVLTNTDGSTSTVDLKSLIAVVQTNTPEVIISGDGTPATPLAASFTPAVKQILVQAALLEVVKVPEMTGNTSNILTWIESRQISENSFKVYRNGLRQNQGVDFTHAPGAGATLSFTENFAITMNVPETIIVEYKVTA